MIWLALKRAVCFRVAFTVQVAHTYAFLAGFFAAAFFGFAAFGFLAAAFGFVTLDAVFFAFAGDFGFFATDFFAAAFFGLFVAFFTAFLGDFAFLAALGVLGFFATAFFGAAFVFSPRRKLPVAPVPFACFREPLFTPDLSAIFRCVLMTVSFLPTLYLATMYLRIACRDEPPRSFRLPTAAAIISVYFG